MKVLAIETASPPGSLALYSMGEISVFRQLDSAQRTTESFAVVMRDMLSDANWRPSDIDLVATTHGPGSFTGLRIGITAAKVFAHAVGAKAVSINTLELIAWQAPIEGMVEAVMNAQRGELFAARFVKNGNTLTEEVATSIIGAEEWLVTRAVNCKVTGPGLKKIIDQLKNGATPVDEGCWEPSAKTLAELAVLPSSSRFDIDVMSLVPQYFRKSAAEEKADNALRQ